MIQNLEVIQHNILEKLQELLKIIPNPPPIPVQIPDIKTENFLNQPIIQVKDDYFKVNEFEPIDFNLSQGFRAPNQGSNQIISSSQNGQSIA